MLKNLHECIDNIVNEVSKEISNINFGGCGWFTYYICREFENIGVVYSIINYNNKSELKNNLLFAKKNIDFPDNKLGFHHLMVKVLLQLYL